eukprot:2601521-Amphidinium_carterae.1
MSLRDRSAPKHPSNYFARLQQVYAALDLHPLAPLLLSLLVAKVKGCAMLDMQWTARPNPVQQSRAAAFIRSMRRVLRALWPKGHAPTSVC